ncbi:MAG: hypothetical protein MJ033_03010 [Victivallaceae bacterium]|nr:hypothetical protein [Victivallaceae bacterium]
MGILTDILAGLCDGMSSMSKYAAKNYREGMKGSREEYQANAEKFKSWSDHLKGKK